MQHPEVSTDDVNQLRSRFDDLLASTRELRKSRSPGIEGRPFRSTPTFSIPVGDALFLECEPNLLRLVEVTDGHRNPVLAVQNGAHDRRFLVQFGTGTTKTGLDDVRVALERFEQVISDAETRRQDVSSQRLKEGQNATHWEIRRVLDPNIIR